jgi:hypothetical protein
MNGSTSIKAKGVGQVTTLLRNDYDLFQNNADHFRARLRSFGQKVVKDCIIVH